MIKIAQTFVASKNSATRIIHAICLKVFRNTFETLLIFCHKLSDENIKKIKKLLGNKKMWVKMTPLVHGGVDI